MPHPDIKRRKPKAVVVLILLLACAGLAACGSSKGPSATTAKAAASTGAAGSPRVPDDASARLTALGRCLRKNGITSPKPSPGSPGTGTASSPPSKGITRPQYAAALKKCAGSQRNHSPFNRSDRLQALGKFAACMRQNGVNIPAPNTSGKGAIFSAKGFDTTSSHFRSGLVKCQIYLGGGVGARPPAAGGPTSAPPSPSGR